jgi:hypothetical protein
MEISPFWMEKNVLEKKHQKKFETLLKKFEWRNQES